MLHLCKISKSLIVTCSLLLHIFKISPSRQNCNNFRRTQRLKKTRVFLKKNPDPVGFFGFYLFLGFYRVFVLGGQILAYEECAVAMLLS